MAKKQEKEVERWVTVNGARIPIFKDGSMGGPKELRDKLKAHADKKANKKSSDTTRKEENTYENRQKLKKQIDDYRATHRNPTAEDRKIVKQMRDKYDAMVKEHMDGIKTKVNAELNAKSKRDAQEKELEDLKQEHFKLSKHDEDDIPSRDAKLNSLEKQIKEKEDHISSNKSSTSGSKERLSVYERQLAEVNDELAYAPKSKALRNEEAIKELEKKKAQLEGYIAKEKAIPTKKETNGETKHYSVYQPKNILGDETHTRLERIEAKSEAEAVAKYKEKYPKASDENIGISRTTKEGGRYQNPDGSWDDGHMYKDSAKNDGGYKSKYYTESELKDAQFRKDALAEMNRYERNWSSYSLKERRNISPNGVKELRNRIKEIENYEKASKANTIKANDDLKEKQIARNKAEKDAINGKTILKKEVKPYVVSNKQGAGEVIFATSENEAKSRWHGAKVDSSELSVSISKNSHYLDVASRMTSYLNEGAEKDVLKTFKGTDKLPHLQKGQSYVLKRTMKNGQVEYEGKGTYGSRLSPSEFAGSSQSFKSVEAVKKAYEERKNLDEYEILLMSNKEHEKHMAAKEKKANSSTDLSKISEEERAKVAREEIANLSDEDFKKASVAQLAKKYNLSSSRVGAIMYNRIMGRLPAKSGNASSVKGGKKSSSKVANETKSSTMWQKWVSSNDSEMAKWKIGKYDRGSLIELALEAGVSEAKSLSTSELREKIFSLFKKNK